MLGIKRRAGHFRIWLHLFIRSYIFRTKLQLCLLALRRRCEAIDSKAQVRQDIVVNDIVQEYGIRIESLFRQDNAIVKCFVFTNRPILSIRRYDCSNFRSITM